MFQIYIELAKEKKELRHIFEDASKSVVSIIKSYALIITISQNTIYSSCEGKERY